MEGHEGSQVLAALGVEIMGKVLLLCAFLAHQQDRKIMARGLLEVTAAGMQTGAG